MLPPVKSSYKDDQRVVITGLGIMTTLGQDLQTYYKSLISGQSGITQWKQLSELSYSKIGGDMSDFNLIDYFDNYRNQYSRRTQCHAKQLLSSVCISGQLAALSSLQAYYDAGFQHYIDNSDPERIGHLLAGHNISSDYTYKSAIEYHQSRQFNPKKIIYSEDHEFLAVINNLLTLSGPSFTVGGACASSNMALYTALNMIRSHQVDAVLVSGAGNDFCPLILDAWSIMGAISINSFNNTPKKGSRPFDAKREGFVPSFGSASIILENYTHAKSRGAPIYGELLGATICMNANRLAKPFLEGVSRTMEEALVDAKLNPEQVDYINAHATSTPLGDALEVDAIKQVFGDHAYQLPINSTKSMLGHCLSSAGAVEFVAMLLQLQHNIIHPTINQEEKDPQLDLFFVPNHAIDRKIKYALSNTFGFGGYNSTVIVGKLSA